MAQAMTHRGPDGEGTWEGERVGLAFRRLAIIDLHERSNQPLHLGGLHLVFNGEIYNYRELREELGQLGHAFETEGDGEVLLHAWAQWGEEALQRLNGMFAFAVADELAQRLTIVSDPFGEKPLYYVERGGRLAFASDIRALLAAGAVDPRPDETALGAYLGRGTFPAPGQSFFLGVRRLPGAHLLQFENGTGRLRRWWRPQPAGASPRTLTAAGEALQVLLEDSVRLRLRSDVPVGTSLSGGVDSSAVVGLVGRMAPEHARHCFTARFPGFERDEWEFAAEAARAAGVTEHHAVVPTAEELIEDLRMLVRDHEEPVSGSSIYAQWRVMRAAAEAGVTVLLDGQGGDETFAGYDAAAGFALRSMRPLDALRELSHRPRLAAQAAVALAIDHGPRPIAAAWHRRAASPYASVASARAGAQATIPPGPAPAGADPLHRELVREAQITILPELLRYADRNSMAHSREVRLPLLDKRIFDFAQGLDSELLWRDGETKRVLREAVRPIVPARILARRDKVGFETPQRSWLDTPAAIALAGEVLLDPAARARGLYDDAAIEADVRAGSWREPTAAWRALNAELWLRELT